LSSYVLSLRYYSSGKPDFTSALIRSLTTFPKDEM
jgi:hypothetical protein